ncbi:outer membrane beta-barrel protein [Ramlibacter humi]|uniref:Outer membrane protein beta-barrel domain-containing protein n=1 Tax=Ramlibacter humi TaxID=2530451 RepID=A0A4Z0BXB1_9BURK|nr:outer membrane beta-barrel protein [Ramlibacter humi]TFZ03977.1 hypothetical protein EZ216_10080 [Ramlibacter humi]
MAQTRFLRSAATGAALTLALAGMAHAQLVNRTDPWAKAPTSAPGLAPAKAQVNIGCGASLLPCADESATLAARQNPSSLRWSVEVAQPTFGPASRISAGPNRQGLSLSLLGQRPVGAGFSVYGKLGTTYTTADLSTGPVLAGGMDSGAGMSFGAGVSWDFSPRLSATFGWDSYDLRGGASGRESLRATSLGLQYRY